MVSETGQQADLSQPSRRRLTAEVWIVLGLSLGQSGVYAAVNLIGRYLASEPVSEQTATLNQSEDAREYLDLAYQLLGIGFALVPVALALYLLSGKGGSAVRAIGLDVTQPLRDLAYGAVLAAIIGIPGLGIYALGRELGVTATVVPSGLYEYWWTIPVLVLAAAQNAILEEVVAVGYLMTRLRQVGWRDPLAIAASALLRGSYHLYQGVGMAIGNMLMGVVFAWWFRRSSRVMPLVIAHTILDVVSFVGYALLKDVLSLP